MTEVFVDVILKISREASVPIHEQVRAGILARIRGLDSNANKERLFTEVELARSNNISLAPVRQAIDLLVTEGIVERRRAKGVFLAGENVMSVPRKVTFVIPDAAHSFYGLMIRGAENAAKSSNYDIVIVSSDMSEEEEYSVLTQLEASEPHPVIICSLGGEKNVRQVERLVLKGFTVVAADQYPKNWVVSSVSNDNVKIGFDATSYLLESGHRKIAFLTEEDAVLPNVSERQSGYEQAMSQAGLDTQIFCIYYHYKNESWDKVIKPRVVKWLSSMPQSDWPTALFVVNDTNAVGVLWALDELGISVPDEMSVMGCADLDFARMLTRPLTTVCQNSYMMGKTALELAVSQSENQNDKIVHKIQPHKIIARSTVKGFISTDEKKTRAGVGLTAL